MRRILYSFFALSLILSSAAPAHAALTETQIQAILGMISAFGADSTTLSNVNASLRGQPVTTTSSTNYNTTSGGDPRLVGNTSGPTTTTSSTNYNATSGGDPRLVGNTYNPATDFSGITCYTFSSDVTTWSSGQDIRALQALLARGGFLDMSKDGYTNEVRAAVIKFQQRYGILRTGYVGPVTRAKLNSLYGCNTTSVNYTQPYGSIDPSSLTAKDNILLTGKATNVTSVGITISNGDKLYGSGPIQVTNGGWSHRVSITLPSSYTVYLYDQNNVLLATEKYNSGTPTTGTAPVITAAAAKAAGNLEIDAGGTVIIQGTALSGSRVFIGGYSAPVTQTGDTLIFATAPSFLVPGQTYDLSIVTQYGRSNAVKVKVISKVSYDTTSTTLTPSITSISPSSAPLNSRITISGANLTSGGHPKIEFYSSNGTLAGVVYFINTNYISAGEIVFNSSATNGPDGSSSVALSPGVYQVSVSTPAGKSNTMSFTITSTQAPVVTASAPSIASFSPTSVPSGTSATLVITGSGFQPGSVVVYSGPTTGELSASYVSVTGNQMNVGPYVLDTAGTYTFYVRNPDGGTSGVSSPLTVTSSTVSTSPTVSSLSPSSFRAGQSGVTVHVLGTNFQSGAQIVVTDDPNGSGYTIPATFNSSTDLSIVTGTLIEGTYYFYVSNPDGKTSSLSSIAVGPALSANVLQAFRKIIEWF